MNLSIQNLSKTYPNGVKAIDNVSLNIESGMFGLLGPNGAGKSSLMRTIATLQSPDEGFLSFNGIDIRNDQMELRKNLGYLPQEFGVYSRESAESLLDYFAILKGISVKKERQSKVEEVLHLTNLYDVRKKHVSGYSGGMKRRFGIAQILLNHPKLIIVDEPTAGLDPAERNRFLNVLREIGSDNIVIFSTHLVEDVRELCSDMAIMGQGRILKNISPTDAIQQIKGNVWSIKIDQSSQEDIKSKYQVLSSSYNENNTMTLRVWSETQLGPEFSTTDPMLQDVYFSTLLMNEIENHDV